MKNSTKWRINSCIFFLSIIIFVLLKYYLKEDVSRYAYLSFLLFPISLILNGNIRSISYELIVLITYLVLGFAFKWWHPGWVLFLTIPIFNIIFPKKIKRVNIKNFKSKIIINEDEY